jgi:Pyruvate/2-oxoacid:ferredoxin oxidoreductase gamma subunit
MDHECGMLGAFSSVAPLLTLDSLGEVVTEKFPKAAQVNLKALKVGAEAAKG